ncbi:MAG: 1,6-dihydroxycyclohexa-2,4-diene-1-carboxylate dehydrogenase [Betaproteobacteria bacterium]
MKAGCRRFEGKVAVVTGAAQGLGRATALRLAAEGASVVMGDRAQSEGEKVRDEVRALGAQCRLVIADLETWEGAERLMKEAHAAHGRIDVSVHNVGGTIWAKPYHEYAIDEIEKEVRRTLWPTLWSCRAVIPYMIERKAGVIVNVGSVATRAINRVPYSASKGGVHALTVCLALELVRHNIRVNCVAPGGIDVGQRTIPRGPPPATEQEAAWRNETQAFDLDDMPMRRLGSPAELAAAIAFAASDEASYMTGEIVTVSGGATGTV